jgi:hypothetical protein
MDGPSNCIKRKAFARRSDKKTENKSGPAPKPKKRKCQTSHHQAQSVTLMADDVVEAWAQIREETQLSDEDVARKLLSR